MGDISSSNEESRYLRNLRYPQRETIPKLFHLDELTAQKGKRFAQLLGITHSELIDKSVEEYISNHQSEVPVTFSYDPPLRISPEAMAAITAEADAHKLILRQRVNGLKTAIDRQARSDHLITLCSKLTAELKKTGHFLKSARDYHDHELQELLNEADIVIKTVHNKTIRGDKP